MLNTASTNNPETPEVSKLVCFDGPDLDQLDNLRKLFEEANLAVIDNHQHNTPCLYQVINFDGSLSDFIPEKALRESTRCLLITQSWNEGMDNFITKYPSVKMVQVEKLPLSKNESRVVFGLLFSNEKNFVPLEQNKPAVKNGEGIITKDTYPRETWEEKQKSINSLVEKQYTHPIKKRNMKKRFFLLFRYVFLMCFGFVLVHAASLFFSMLLLVGVIYYPKFNLETPLYSALGFSVVSGKTITQLVSFVPVVKTYNIFLESLDRATDIVAVLKELNSENYVNNDIVSPLAQLGMLSSGWIKIYPQLSLIESNLKNLNKRVGFVYPFSTILPAITSSINTTIERGNTLESFARLYSQTLNKQKSYLLLFQNSNELRPTGGFIGSLALLRVTNGAIGDIEILDVYDVDGQLRGHVDPPYQIQTLLEQEHWYLRDSNWSPNFIDSADKAAFFLSKSLGTSIDGVIAINLPVLKQILNITGPIVLHDNNTTLSDTSVVSFLQETIKNKSFSGSTLKKDLLTDIKDSLIQKFSSLSKTQLLQLGGVFASSLVSKDVQLFSYEKNEEDVILRNNWGGVFPPTDVCKTQKSSCFQEYVAMIEANLGVNKNSEYIQRSLFKKLEVLNNEFKRQDTFTWENRAHEESSASGNYRMYTRFYYPTGTSVTSITLDEQKIPITNATNSGRLLPYAELLDEFSGLVTVGIGMDVPQQEKKTLTISSHQPLSLPPKTLVINMNKQPGVSNIPIEFSLTAGKGVKQIINTADSSVAKSNTVTYNTSLWRDNSLFFNIITEE